MMYAHKAVFAVLESNLQKAGWTVPRFQIMFYLYFEGPLAPSEIAHRLIVTRGNITAFLRRLVADKLIKAVTGNSELRPKYALTIEGKRGFETIFPPHAARVKKLVPSLDHHAIEQLNRIKENAERLSKTMR